MRPVETINAARLGVIPMTVRPDNVRALTSTIPGKITPLAFFPLLREDRVSSGKVRVKIDMAETIFPLMNAVNWQLFAHFVPYTACERFYGLDSFNRAVKGIPEPQTDEVIDYLPKVAFDRNSFFWRKLGVHWKQGEMINRAPMEAYNVLVNWRRKMRSDKISLRNMTDDSLARGFWLNPNLWHIVPDFDAASMDGQATLTLSGRAPVSGIGWDNTANTSIPDPRTVRQTNGSGSVIYDGARVTNSGGIYIRTEGQEEELRTNVWAELENRVGKVSLANIEAAKQTAAFAKMRERYTGIDDDHLIDLLMEGVRIPDEELRFPILLDKKSGIFNYRERFATDGDNLEQSVTTGMAMAELNIRTPPMNTGGIILVTLEIMPEALLERKRDTYLGANTGGSDLPNQLADFLDPQKVQIVNNQYVDVEHSAPSETFGYAPLNHDWRRDHVRLGGRFYRPLTEGFVEDRQRFWSVELLDPTLADGFYLAPNVVPKTVFADSNADPFEVLTVAQLSIVGNTQFGALLSEDDGNYAKVEDYVRTGRIVQPEEE